MNETLIVGDITKIKVDAIVNSVGVGKATKEYGGICGSILKAANPKLKDFINKAQDVYVLGEFFVTEGYGLPTSHIIHLMAPFYEEDLDFVIYKDCIRRVLRECVRRGFNKIAIPLVGTGANKYPEEETISTLCSIAEKFNEAYLNQYQAFIVLPENDISVKNKNRLDIEMPDEGRRRNIEKDVKKGSAKYFEEHNKISGQKIGKEYFEYDEDDDTRASVLPSSFKKQPNDVIEYANFYAEKRYLKNEQLEKAANERVRAFVGFGADNPKTAGSKAMSQITPYSDINRFFVMIFGLKMPLIKAHGSSQSYAVFCALRTAASVVRKDVNNKVQQALLSEKPLGE